MMKLLKSITLVLILVLLTAACSSGRLTPAKIAEYNNSGSDYVVLMHGLWNSSSRMEDFEEFYSSAGYQTINLDYPSTKHTMDVLSEKYIRPLIKAIPLQSGQKIHFVTHSMGGVLLRHYLKRHPLTALGRVVMLSPPNQGTEIANLLITNSFYKRLAGPAAYQLRTKNNTYFDSLGAVHFELGIIAGNKTYFKKTDELLPGIDDGMISLENTKVNGMNDFIVLNEHHRGLTRNLIAMRQSETFLKNGKFIKEQ